MSKYSKIRECPALGQAITSVECAEGRGNRFVCPIDCVFSPFAPVNRDRFIELNDKVESIFKEEIFAETRKSPRLKLEMQTAADNQDPFIFNQWKDWVTLFKRDSDGCTLIERLEKRGFPKTTNDERLLLKAKAQARMILVEIDTRVSSFEFGGVDLLNPELGAQRLIWGIPIKGLPRFTVVLAAAYPLGGKLYVLDAAMFLMEPATIEPIDWLTTLVRHLGGPDTLPELQPWLMEHQVRLRDCIDAVYSERSRLLDPAYMQANHSAAYTLEISDEQILALIRERIEFSEIPLTVQAMASGYVAAFTFDCLKSESMDRLNDDKISDETDSDNEEDDSEEDDNEEDNFGILLIETKGVRLETDDRDDLYKLQDCFEKILQSQAKLIRMSVEFGPDGFVPEVALEKLSTAPSLPPSLLQGVPAELFDIQNLQRFLPNPKLDKNDLERARIGLHAESLLALEGRTAPEAALDPVWRPRLICLMKKLIQDTEDMNIRLSCSHNLDWMLTELGLSELL